MFNGAQVHLLLNHVPILGVVFSFLLLGFGMWRKNISIQKTGFGALVLVGLFAIPALKSGEAAEEVIEDRAGISEAMIEEHEEAAEIAFWVLEVFAVVALFALAFFRGERPWPAWLNIALLTGMLVAGGFMARAGHLGGFISHPEIRTGQSDVPAPMREEADEEDEH